MKKIKDILIIAVINVVLFSVFSIVADKENELYLEASSKHITEYTDFKGE